MTTKRNPGQTLEEFKSEHDPAEEVRHLREQLKLKDRERDKYEKEVGGLRVLFDEMAEAIDAIEPPVIEYKRSTKTQVSTPVTYVSHWTDWHNGAVVSPDEIEGFNAFKK